MKKIIGQLEEWGDFVIKHKDHADELGDNILQRYSEFGYTDSAPPGSKILCADMPRKIQAIDIAVNRLGGLEQAAVTLTYCAPIKEDGQQYTKAELAKIIKVNKGKFRALLRSGIRRLEGMRIK